MVTGLRKETNGNEILTISESLTIRINIDE